MTPKITSLLAEISKVSQEIHATIIEMDSKQLLVGSTSNSYKVMSFHKGPHSKGYPQHSSILLKKVKPIGQSGHSILATETLLKKMKNQEKEFQNILCKLTKQLAKSPLCQHLSMYPAIGFSFSKKEVTAVIHMRKDTTNLVNLFYSDPLLDISKHWNVFCKIVDVYSKGDTYGTGTQWTLVHNEGHNEYERHYTLDKFENKGSIHCITAPTAQEARNYLAALYLQKSLLSNGKIDVYQHAPTQKTSITSKITAPVFALPEKTHDF
jgi:hypothetical protein